VLAVLGAAVLVGALVLGATVLGGIWFWQSVERSEEPRRWEPRAIAAEIGTPQGWSLVAAQDYGNAWCLDICRTTRFLYSADSPVGAYTTRLTAAGFRPEPHYPPPNRRGGNYVGPDRTTVTVQAFTTPPPGLDVPRDATVVSVIVSLSASKDPA
jgi:hypothetical protein